MGIFKIKIDEFSWICGVEDDPDDLCLHGHVTVQIGKNKLQGDGTISATGLYLLKTLKENKIMNENSIQMVPCCGHFMIANDDLSEVEIIGCDTGLDWSVIHENGKIKIILKTGEEESLDFSEYKTEVFKFCDEVYNYYKSSKPKNIPKDEFDRKGYIAFWNEWHRRREEKY